VNPKTETLKPGTDLVKWKGVPNGRTACFQLGVQGAGGAAHSQRGSAGKGSDELFGSEANYSAVLSQ